MNMKEECFKVFSENIGADRKHAIELVIKEAGVTQTTAQTYYSAWRNDLMNTPNAKRGDISTKATPLKASVKPIIEKNEFKTLGVEEVKVEIKEIKWKADVIKSVEVEEKLFEVTKLIPVTMKGKYGVYNFSKEGVKENYNEEFINKDKLDEVTEALKIWEKCYSKEETQ